jgi:predicted amino acid racemase
MKAPRLEINLGKIAHNAKILKELYASKGIDVIGVTKVVCGSTAIAEVLVKSGINILADSRIENIITMHDANIPAKFLLLRTPLSQSELVVKYANISLNSELSVIKELSKYAVKQGITHKVILMADLGDLREGIMPSDLENTVDKVIGLKGIELAGIGTNLACFGGIKPNNKKMDSLSSIVKNIEDKFKLKLEIISGGNSANYDWFMTTKNIGRINNLRLGESIFLGRETLERKIITRLFTDAFTLIAEVIESKTKPSLPYGDIGQDAFGNIPKFTDLGLMKRAILGIGLQDVLVSGLMPLLDIDILGASSDHIIINAKQTEIKVGDTIEFNLDYGALLSAMTSPYIIKIYK